jgi:hypothetical protein
VVQFGHHSYNPTKCRNCSPNTWHWDNISIAPARPFTIINADVKLVTGEEPSQINFPTPAPANAHLRFAAMGANIQLSFDAGKNWQAAKPQNQEGSASHHVSSYWTPIPEGTRAVMLRGEPAWGVWAARDITIWALPEE